MCLGIDQNSKLSTPMGQHVDGRVDDHGTNPNRQVRVHTEVSFARK